MAEMLLVSTKAGFHLSISVQFGPLLGGPGRLEGNEQEVNCTWKSHSEWGFCSNLLPDI